MIEEIPYITLIISRVFPDKCLYLKKQNNLHLKNVLVSMKYGSEL